MVPALVAVQVVAERCWRAAAASAPAFRAVAMISRARLAVASGPFGANGERPIALSFRISEINNRDVRNYLVAYLSSWLINGCKTEVISSTDDSLSEPAASKVVPLRPAL